jgi:hypothetical protein
MLGDRGRLTGGGGGGGGSLGLRAIVRVGLRSAHTTEADAVHGPIVRDGLVLQRQAPAQRQEAVR